MVCLIHGEDCFLSGGGASFFVGRVKLLLLRGGAGGCVAFESGDVTVSFVSLVVPSPELASSMASRGTFGLRCSLSVGACFLAGGGTVGAAAAAASVSSASGDYNVSCFLPFLCGTVGVFVLLLFISGDCIADEVSVSYLFLLSCERVEHLGMMCSPVLGGLLCSFIDIMVSGGRPGPGSCSASKVWSSSSWGRVDCSWCRCASSTGEEEDAAQQILTAESASCIFQFV